jgi:hypothetical protein
VRWTELLKIADLISSALSKWNDVLILKKEFRLALPMSFWIPVLTLALISLFYFS